MSSDHRGAKEVTRRGLLQGFAGAAAVSSLPVFQIPALAQGARFKVGFMLPYTGTLAKLGQSIDNGFRLYVEQKGSRLGGRQVAFAQVDDESKPETVPDNMSRLIGRDKADVVVGSGHSGVAIAMVKVARDTKAMLIIPNAGANDATGLLCAPNIFQTSFSNWQPNFPMGRVWSAQPSGQSRAARRAGSSQHHGAWPAGACGWSEAPGLPGPGATCSARPETSPAASTGRCRGRPCDRS